MHENGMCWRSKLEIRSGVSEIGIEKLEWCVGDQNQKFRVYWKVEFQIFSKYIPENEIQKYGSEYVHILQNDNFRG